MKAINEKSDVIFDIVNVSLVIILGIIFLWPLLFVVSASFSDPNAVWAGKVILFPRGVNLNGYVHVFKYHSVWVGYKNTIIYTFLGTILNVVLTICAAYPLSRKDFKPRRIITLLLVFTMYFSGGLIPTYLVVNKLRLVNTPLAMILPSAISMFNVIITRTYFETSIPPSLQDAAEIDGFNTLQYLLKVVLPLSKPILAVIALYYGVAHWNSYFNGLIYLHDSKLFPLQLILRDILIQNNITTDMLGLNPEDFELKSKLAETMKYSLIITASLPALIIYPFIQKHFVKGIMVGAIKG